MTTLRTERQFNNAFGGMKVPDISNIECTCGIDFVNNTLESAGLPPSHLHKEDCLKTIAAEPMPERKRRSFGDNTKAAQGDFPPKLRFDRMAPPQFIVAVRGGADDCLTVDPIEFKYDAAGKVSEWETYAARVKVLERRDLEGGDGPWCAYSIELVSAGDMHGTAMDIASGGRNLLDNLYNVPKNSVVDIVRIPTEHGKAYWYDIYDVS